MIPVMTEEIHFGRGHLKDVCPRCQSPRSVKILKSGKHSRFCDTCRKLRQRARKYGISFEELLVLYASKRCAICLKPIEVEGRDTALDHDTQGVRGVLCMSCNLLLGQAKDSIWILGRAILYLRKAGVRGYDAANL